MQTSRGLALTLALLLSAACHRTKVVGLDQGLASERVWVTMKNESVVVLFGPKIYGNKLVGFVDGKYAEYLTANVTKVSVRESNRAGTAALLAAGLVAFAGFAYAITGSGGSRASDYCDDPNNVGEVICQT